MKISILFKFIEGSWGGGNQFLKGLKKEFIRKGIYEENPERAEIILFNGYPFRYEHFFNEILQLKQRFSSKIVVHRLDGPISFVRGKDEEIDKIIFLFNRLFVDGIIFQSNWCRKQNKKYFKISSRYETVIHNGPDNEIFNKENKEEFNSDGKIKLIAASWSSNWRKGFEFYKFLDENLDFSTYEMTFVGNSPIKFKNIKCVKPILPEKLAEIFKKNDIYITASQNDPCSNSLIEALSCGLPAVALNNGGHSELVKRGGEIFNRKEDILEKIEKIAKNYYWYQSQIPKFSIEKVAQRYYEFGEKICKDVLDGKYQPKQVKFFTKINFYKMKFMILRWKGLNKLGVIKRKL